MIVFVGVNGVGKSTNLAKVAYKLKNAKLSVMLAACDNFRAGAVEHHDILKQIKSKNKGASIITESLKSNKISETDTDSGTLLDENNIL